jgi:hypothetical protein
MGGALPAEVCSAPSTRGRQTITVLLAAPEELTAGAMIPLACPDVSSLAGIKLEADDGFWAFAAKAKPTVLSETTSMKRANQGKWRGIVPSNHPTYKCLHAKFNGNVYHI